MGEPHGIMVRLCFPKGFRHAPLQRNVARDARAGPRDLGRLDQLYLVDLVELVDLVDLGGAGGVLRGIRARETPSRIIENFLWASRPPGRRLGC